MSKTLSKILVICALAVVFPLMIVGTALASFYSLESTLVIEAYAGVHSMPVGAFASVQHGDNAGKEISITDGHLKTVTLKTLSNGYDFVGWYAGTVEDYASETAPEFVSEEANIDVKLSDYSNLVAVFEIKSYNVTSWNYVANPETNELATTKPEGAKDVYYWGDKLPELEHAHHDFNGWKLDGQQDVVNVAKFENSGDISLTAGADAWTSHGQVTINYYDEENNLISTASETIYKGEDYDIKAVADVVTVEAGCAYHWVDSAQNVASGTLSISKDFAGNEFNFYLKKNLISYTATLLQDVPAYKNNTTITFTKQDTSKLTEIFDENNWNIYSFSEVTSISYNGVEYSESQIADFVNAVINGAENAVEITATIDQNYENVAIGSISYETTSQGAVFEKLGDSYASLYPMRNISRSSTWTLDAILGIEFKTLVDADDSDANPQVLKLANLKIQLSVGGTILDYAVSAFNLTTDMSFNDLIEIIISDERNANVYFESDEIFEISSITAIFSPVV